MIKNFVTKKNIIIFSGITNYSYNGNSRYLFEYLSKNTDYEIYWFTRSDEIKKHIEEKGHLPNIPSTKEVKANGIELGEMNRLLLEKIEELTLYILNQERRIKKLENLLKNDK